MIPFEIRSKECVPDEVRKYADRRVQFVLNRFRNAGELSSFSMI
jgi:hypothetical protein